MKFKKQDAVGMCLEAAFSEVHYKSRREQLKMPGEKQKLIALFRTLPRFLGARALNYLQVETLPFSGVGKAPVGYGGEAVVSKVALNGANFAVKKFHTQDEPEQLVSSYKENQQLMNRYLPEFMVPAAGVVFESQYEAGKPKFCIVQEWVEGVCAFTDGLELPTDQVSRFYTGAVAMQEDTGMLPDIASHGNLMLTDTGNLRLVDASLPINVADIDRTPFLRERLDYFATVAAPLAMQSSDIITVA